MRLSCTLMMSLSPEFCSLTLRGLILMATVMLDSSSSAFLLFFYIV